VFASAACDDGGAECERIVFVTSLTYTGALGGVEGGDTKCRERASASRLARVNGRQFLGWLGSASTNPAQRMVHGRAAYVLPRGEVVAADWESLTSGSLQGLIAEDESGSLVGPRSVWTGVTVDGNSAGANCADWSTTEGTGRCGNTASKTSWTNSTAC